MVGLQVIISNFPYQHMGILRVTFFSLHAWLILKSHTDFSIHGSNEKSVIFYKYKCTQIDRNPTDF